jgi:hypothetical protein
MKVRGQTLPPPLPPPPPSLPSLRLRLLQIGVGVTTIDVSQIIGKAPVQIMAVHWDPVQHPELMKEAAEGGKRLEYLYDVEIWHERTMPAAARSEEETGQDG